MKKNTSLMAALLLMICVSISLNAADAPGADKTQQENRAVNSKDLGYAVGILFGASLKEMNISEISYDAVIQGIKDSQNGSSAKMTREEAVVLVKKAVAVSQEKIGEENSVKEKEFLLTNSKKKGVTTTPSGLQYESLREGTGKKPSAEDMVKVHYHGTLLNGTVFDSSVQRNEPVAFRLNEVISGWTEGVQLMSVGSKYRFFIPSKLGYGPRAAGTIPPNSLLIFEVELLSIEK